MDLTPLEPWIAHKIGATGALTRDALTAYQLAALNETLAWVRARSPFYRERLADAPPTLAALEDLPALPFTTADDIQTEPLRFVCVSQSEISRVVTLDTSGTTGHSKRLYFTADDQALTVDFFQAGMSTFTRPGDRVLILLRGPRRRVDDALPRPTHAAGPAGPRGSRRVRRAAPRHRRDVRRARPLAAQTHLQRWAGRLRRGRRHISIAENLTSRELCSILNSEIGSCWIKRNGTEMIRPRDLA